MSAIILRFVRSKGISSDFIAWRGGWTGMPFVPTHVECVTPDGGWLGQRANGGMQVRSAHYDRLDVKILPDGRRAEAFINLPVSQTQADAFYAAARAAIGQPYDWRAILGFTLPWHEHTKFRAICSAKMVLLLRTKGCEFFRWPLTAPAHLIDPRDLMLMLSSHVEIPH